MGAICAGSVTAVVINWNGREDTLECIASLERSGHPLREIILADNGSSDGSVAAVRAAFPGVVVIENRENTGFCRANNAAIALALEHGAEYLLVLNNDAVAEPSLVGELKAAADADPRIAAVSPVIAAYGDPARIYFDGTMIDWGNGDICSQFPHGVVEAASESLDVDFACWCCALIRTDAVRRAGMLDEDFFAYYEDADWSVRCRRRGLRTVLYPRVLARHKISRSTGGENNPAVSFYLFRNRMLFMRKNAPVLRKIQFSFCYTGELLERIRLSPGRDQAQAAAARDGFWSAVNGCFGKGRLTMPAGYGAGAFDAPRLWWRALKAVFGT